MKNRALAALCAAALVGAAPRLSALSALAPATAEQQPLPDFAVTAPDGAAAASATLQSPGQWVLVYLFPGSAPSDRLVQWLGEHWTADRAPRIVFIVSGTPAAAKSYLLSKGGDALAADARWFADTRGAAWTALAFQGTLAVAGVAGARIDWKVDGVISDPSVLTPALEKWIGF